MKKTLSLLFYMAAILPFTTYGKPTNYSWTENDKTHYGELIPHGVTNHSTLSSRGLKIKDNRKAKPQANRNPSEVPTSAEFEEKKCDLTRTRIELFDSKKTIATLGSQSKVIPPTREQINTELAQAKSETKQYCNPSTTKHK